MPNPVSIANLEARFRPLTDAEKDSAQELLDDAWAVLLGTVPDLESRMGSGATSVSLVHFVVAAMVMRVLRNPNGVRQWAVDDYSETRDSSVAAGSLYVSADEVALLTGSAARRGGAFSVAPPPRTVRAPGAEHDVADLAALRYGHLFR